MSIISNINLLLLTQLPSAFFTGVRLKSLEDKKAVTTVKYQWINQNPFKSMYFAVQCMASELSTGVLVLKKIQDSDKKISMLVTEQHSTFSKKARGRIYFTCDDGYKINKVIQDAINTGECQTIELTSIGVDEQGDEVSRFIYQWSLKLKS